MVSCQVSSLEIMRLTFTFHFVDKNLMNHIRTATKRRDPTIVQLAGKYNKLVGEIAALIRQKKGVPHGARAPLPIECSGLFALDVDDAIWEDLDCDDESQAPPPWLADEDVRQGIQLLHEGIQVHSFGDRRNEILDCIFDSLQRGIRIIISARSFVLQRHLRTPL